MIDHQNNQKNETKNAAKMFIDTRSGSNKALKKSHKKFIKQKIVQTITTHFDNLFTMSSNAAIFN